jgi:uncharacterized protein YqiB (DUF1249 family)
MILLRDDDIRFAHDLSGTFAGLMDLYERNYISLRRLVPVIPPMGTAQVSQVEGGLAVHLHVVERFRYTTELSLTYYFEREDKPVPEPNLRMRIYHDARLAELMSAHLRHWPAFESEQHTGLHARWHVNRFLYKWLNY